MGSCCHHWWHIAAAYKLKLVNFVLLAAVLSIKSLCNQPKDASLSNYSRVPVVLEYTTWTPTRSMGLDRIHPRVQKELSEVLSKLLSVIDISPGELGRSQLTGVCRMWHTSTRRVLQTCQSDLSAREGHGVDQLECHHTACTGKPHSPYPTREPESSHLFSLSERKIWQQMQSMGSRIYSFLSSCLWRCVHKFL